MTNEEKFKTANERLVAFVNHCNSQGSCRECILKKYSGNACRFAWLDLEYKEELKRCPFCGGEAGIVSGIHEGCEYHWVECSECYGRSIGSSSADRTIAAWNRRAT